MTNRTPTKLIAELQLVASELSCLAPELVALARHLETAASRGDTVGAVSLGDAVTRIVDRLRDH